MSWFIPAVGFSFFFAAYLLANQHFRISGPMMVLWRGMGGFIVLTPIVIFLPWPRDPVFYIVIAALGIIAGIYERQTYTVAASGNAGGLSRLLPLSLWVSFLTWLLISPELCIHYAEHPLQTGIIIAALAICGLGMLFMQRTNIDARLFRDVMPIVILRGITDVLNKTAMMHGGDEILVALPIYVWWISLWLCITVLVQNRLQIGKFLPDNPFRPEFIKPGITITIIMIGLSICKGGGMRLAPNPAYVTATALLSAVWVTLYHRIRREPDPSNLWAGALIVVGTFGLVLAGG